MKFTNKMDGVLFKGLESAEVNRERIEHLYDLYKVAYEKEIPHYAYFTNLDDAEQFAKDKQGILYYRVFSTNEWKEFIS